MPLEKDSEQDAIEPESVDEAWKLNALRSVIESTFDAQNNLDKSLELISLKDIILVGKRDRKTFEAYIKLQEGLKTRYGNIDN